ncbi:MAG: TrkH family potassium uptake protein [Marinilabiliaceae bacterium]|nr:TrkH family potassium uptake protein [Marinilabiliaceae bacterium]
MLNIKIIFRFFGLVLVIEGLFMLLTSLVSLIYNENDLVAFLISALICIITGGSIALFTGNAKRQLGKREGYIMVTMIWVVFSFFGLLPFLISGAIPSFTDAFFETMSGFTTTGSSILNNIEELPHGILFWRSIIQWLGGMGIIVLSLAILPILGVGGMQLFEAEVPGITADKLHPRITDTAKRLWLIYVSFTAIEAVLLIFGGMSFFDAVCHSFTTMATGGYSTKQASVAHWDSPYIHYVITLFMFIAGMNFTLSYAIFKGKFERLKDNDELRFYSLVVLIFTVIISVALYFTEIGYSVERSFRDALFQVVSIVTTTGYATADYMAWVPSLSVLIFLLMFFGGSAGSTGGGIKMVRIQLLMKNSRNELKRLIHPNAVIPVRFNGRAVPQSILYNVLAFVVIYLMIVGVSMIVMSMMGFDLQTSLGAVATSIGNIGPGLNELGPAYSFSEIPALGKWFLSLLMLIGRLELFTVIVLFSSHFWKH